MNGPSVDDPNHAALEARVETYLQDKGFSVWQMTYHECLPKELATTLSRQFDETSLYLRGRADRVAIGHDVSFEYECKTTSTGDYKNIAVEVLPLLHHLLQTRLGVRCLYAHWNTITGREVGFWVKDRPPVELAWFPPNGRWGDATWLRHACLELLPEARPKTAPVKGSGDPFVLIAADTAEMLPHWKMQIDRFIDELQTPPTCAGESESNR